LKWNQIDSLSGRLYFSDLQNGWLVNVNGIYHTDNGGKIWKQQTSIRGYYNIFFTDSIHGWAFSIQPTGSDLVGTKDGGASWRYLFRFDYSLQKIFFIDSLKGWAVGEYGAIYRTQDGGDTWNLSRIGKDTEDCLFDVFFIDDSTGWAVGESNFVWHTINGGAFWQRHPTPALPGEWLNAVHFTDKNHGWIVGMVGLMMYTENGGKDWDRSYSQEYGYWWSDVDFTDRDHGWAVGLFGAVYKWEGTSFVHVHPGNHIPCSLILHPAYPNPFLPCTQKTAVHIHFTLFEQKNVTVKIYNALGQLVRIYCEKGEQPGYHSIVWDGNDQSGQALAGGIYLYQIQAGDKVMTDKLTLIR
jgi:hypothetical protein